MDYVILFKWESVLFRWDLVCLVFLCCFFCFLIICWGVWFINLLFESFFLILLILLFIFEIFFVKWVCFFFKLMIFVRGKMRDVLLSIVWIVFFGMEVVCWVFLSCVWFMIMFMCVFNCFMDMLLVFLISNWILVVVGIFIFEWMEWILLINWMI